MPASAPSLLPTLASCVAYGVLMVLLATQAPTVAGKRVQISSALETKVGNRDVALRFGNLPLPQLKSNESFPPECANFTEICELEKAGEYEESMPMLESRMARCSTLGWEKLGHVGSGHNAGGMGVCRGYGAWVSLSVTAHRVMRHCVPELLLLDGRALDVLHP